MEVSRKNTIVHLKPDISTECAPTDYVLYAASLMSKNRTHCVLVKDSLGNLLGLFTAKDLALRVVASGLDPKYTQVKDIMTLDPVKLHMNTPTTRALQVMVNKGIRHLPLSDNQGKIRGVLDITRCFQQAMLKLERVTKNATKLNAILSDVAEDYEDVHTRESQRIMKDIQRLSQLIEVPTIASVVSNARYPVFIDSSSTVEEAAKLMRENNTTALLVRDRTSPSRKVIGIFTSKDICFRVLAKGYDSASSTVARFLTTSPEYAKDDMNISSALRLMFQGNFLNLPVINSVTLEILGIVNVLELTYAMLTQLSKSDEVIEAESFGAVCVEVKARLGDDTITWDRFWNSLEKSTDDIHNLESHVAKSPTGSRSQTPKVSSRRSSWNQMVMNTSSRRSSFNTARGLSNPQRESVSESGSLPLSSTLKRAQPAESLTRTSFYIRAKTVNFIVRYGHNKLHNINMTVNDDASIFDDIKFLELLKKELELKLNIDLNDNDLFYIDEDGDLVTITDELDLIEAIGLAKNNQELNRVDIVIRKHQPQGPLDYICVFLTSCGAKILGCFCAINCSTPVVTGTFLVLSVGVLLGFTFSQRKLLAH